jgi:hypothetical protein
MESNLSKIFIHNFKAEKPTSHKYIECKKTSCKHCYYSNTSFYLKLKNFFLPIMCNSNCKALNIVHIIYCKTCPNLYIGLTNCLRNRFNVHKRNIQTNILEINSELK